LIKKRLTYIIILSVALCNIQHVKSQKDSTLKVETGIASYYHKAFEGRKCSSGDIFRHDSLTAAHKKLKFGTRVRITNLKNDSVVVVKINDRLPYYSKRTIDLTYKAAKQLNFIPQGLTKVKIEILSDSLPKVIPVIEVPTLNTGQN
jgi:rare lipoprotein A